MTETSVALTSRPAWKALQTHWDTLGGVHLRELFAADPARGEQFNADAAGLYFDYSKQRITAETRGLLVALARECGLRERIDAMFRGDKINVSEKRAVLHVALRAPAGSAITVDGTNVVPEVQGILARMETFSRGIRSGEWKGHTGKRIRNVVNIGIGGSDLGPVMAYEALALVQRPRAHAALRFECRRHGLRRGDARPRRRRDAVHRVVEDVHDARDDDQRADRARVERRRARRAMRPSRSTSSRSRPTPTASRSSASTRRTCLDSGIGSAAVTRWMPRSVSRP